MQRILDPLWRLANSLKYTAMPKRGSNIAETRILKIAVSPPGHLRPIKWYTWSAVTPLSTRILRSYTNPAMPSLVLSKHINHYLFMISSMSNTRDFVVRQYPATMPGPQLLRG